MCAKVQHGVRLEDLLQEGVVGRKAVVGRGGAGEEQAHGVALVAKRRLHADEHVAKLLAVDEQLLAVGVEVACTGRGQARGDVFYAFRESLKSNQSLRCRSIWRARLEYVS